MDSVISLLYHVTSLIACVVFFMLGKGEKIVLPKLMKKQAKGSVVRTMQAVQGERDKLKRYEQDLEENPLAKIEDFNIDPNFIDTSKFR